MDNLSAVPRHVIYADFCDTELVEKIKDRTGRTVVLRNEETWSIGYLAQTLTDPMLDLVVVNNINEMALVEIGISAFMCKPILVTANSIDDYKGLNTLVNYVDPGAKMINKGSFINWFEYSIGSKV